MFKKWDIIIIVILILISFIPEIIFGFVMGYNHDRIYAEITIEGDFYKSIPLSEHSGEEVIKIKKDNHFNKIMIRDSKVLMIDADCPDSLCVNQGKISEVGQSIVCLPNKVMIEIKGNKKEENDDDVILSH